MKHLRIGITMLLTTMLSFTGHAQDTVRMSLWECIDYALAHSAEVRMQQADCRDAQLARRNAILDAFTPSISGSTYAYSNFGRSIDPETNTYSTVTSFHNGYSLSAGIMLFNGFQAVNNLKVTKIAEQMGLTKQQQIEDRLRLAVMEAYCNVLYYTELGNVLQAQVNTAEKSMLSAQRQYELGQKSYSDVLHTKAELSDREYQLTICSNHLDNAYITLIDIMLYDNKKVLNIDLEWPDSLSEETVSGSEFEVSRAMQAVGTKYGYYEAPLIADYDSGERSVMPREVMGEPTPITFEGHELLGVEHPDTYLRCLFGDYMQLPPEGKRRIHGFDYVDFNQSYHDYQDTRKFR